MTADLFTAPSRPGRSSTRAALQRARRRHRKYTVAYTGNDLNGYTIRRVAARPLSERGAVRLLNQLIDAGYGWTTVRALSPGHALRVTTAELADQVGAAWETTGIADGLRDQGADLETTLQSSAVTVAVTN